MAIPKNPLFQEFISKVRILEHSTESSVLFSTGEAGTFYLEYPATEPPLDAVLRAISRELEQGD